MINLLPWVRTNTLIYGYTPVSTSVFFIQCTANPASHSTFVFVACIFSQCTRAAQLTETRTVLDHIVTVSFLHMEIPALSAGSIKTSG